MQMMLEKFTNNHTVASVATTIKFYILVTCSVGNIWGNIQNQQLLRYLFILILLLLLIFVELWTLNLGPNTLSLNGVFTYIRLF
jgi:hypothetical protein